MDTQSYWDQQQPLYEKIYKQGMAEYVKDKDVSAVFAPSDRVIRCMDERVQGGIRAGGSLILLTDQQAQEYARMAQPTGITSHAGCGAAKLAYRQKHGLESGAPVPAEQLEEFAQAEAKRLAEVIGVPYRGHITAEQMQGPADAHIARTIYYVGTEEFDPSASAGVLPPGLIVHRRYLQPTYALQEVEVAISIVLDEGHGFGRFISAKNPLLIVVVGDKRATEFSQAKLRDEVEKIEQKYEGKIKIDGFSRP